MLTPPRRRLRPLLVVAVAAAACAVAGVAYAAFFSITSNPASSFSAKRIFPGDRTTSAWKLLDASGGAGEVDTSDMESFFNDVLNEGTGKWATAFASDRYLDFDFSSPLSAGLSASGATFNFSFIPKATTDTACYYFEVRRASTGAVLATHGSTSSPIQCVTGATYTLSSTAVPSVSSTDIANDLRIRVYSKNTTVDVTRVDLATVSGATPYASFTLYNRTMNDVADPAVPTNRPWELHNAGDLFEYLSTASWASTFSTSRYMKLQFPAYLPTSAVVTAASFTHSYRSRNADETCWYFEVYDGTTLIGTHGSAASPISCNTSNTTWVTETVSINEVNTASEGNNLAIRIYAKNSGIRRSQHDLATVTLNYYLD